MQGSLDAFGIARDDREISFGWLVRLRPALFPITESTEGNAISFGELFLSQSQGAAKSFNSWNPTEFSALCLGDRRIFQFADRVTFDFRGAHRSQWWIFQRYFGPVTLDSDKTAVTAHSRDCRVLVHFSSPAERK